MARKKTSQQAKSKSKKKTKKNGAEAAGGDAGGGQARRSTTCAGPVPNLFWGAVSAAELRARTRFIPLPPADVVLPLANPAAARFLRQETAAWRALHTGVLTTGQLKEALGLREAAAARVVGGRKDSSHQPLMAAAKLLQNPHALPPPAGAAAEAACRRRAVDGLCAQLQLRLPGGGGQTPAGAGDEQAAAAGDGDDGPLSQEEQYRRSAAALSSGGLMGVRCAWGKTQEAAALAALLHVFPSCTLHEVGMCCVPEADAPLDLFPLAASPDAIIAHHLLLPQEQVQRLQHGVQQQQQAAAAAACATAAAAADGGDSEESVAAAAVAATLAFRQQTQRLRWQLRELLELVPMARAAGEAKEAEEAEEEEEEEGGGREEEEEEKDGGREEAAEQQAAHESDTDDGEDEEVGSGGVDGRAEGQGAAGGDDVELGCGSGHDGSDSDEGEEVSVPEASSEALSPGANAGDFPPEAQAESNGRSGGLDSSSMGHGAVLERLEVLTRVLGRALAAAAGAAAATGAMAPVLTPTGSTPNKSGGTDASAGAAAAEEEEPHRALLAAVLESRLPAVVLCGDCGGRGSAGGEEASSAVLEPFGAQQGTQGAAAHHESGPSGAAGAEMRPHLCGCAAWKGLSATANGAASAATGAAAGSGAASHANGCSGLQHVVLREVVEVKSTCPFGMRQVRRGGKGRVHTELVLSDPGPRHAVPAAWVPQLQLHMLAAGCQSALVVSRSASKGMTVFRLLRDDEYLQRMIKVLNRLNNEYVRRGLTPPPDMFARQPDYCAFLGITARLARHAIPLYPGRGVWRPPAEEALNRDDAFICRPVEQ